MIKGKIVLVPFPFDDLSATKVRPAVCLTNPVGQYRHVVLAFISSRIPADMVDSDLTVDAAQADFSMTGLQVTSILRLHRLMTVTTALIQRELGTLSQRMQIEADNKLKTLFALSD